MRDVSSPLINATRTRVNWIRVLGLPALLLLVLGLLGGLHYESNDDLIIDLLLRGISGPAPVDNLHLYLHGWSQLLAWLYTHWPMVPWYAWLLYVLLYLALANTFYVLEELNNGYFSPTTLLVAEIAVFACTYFLHATQINFTRPAILLGATAGFLLLAPRAGGRSIGAGAWLLAALALAAAWGIRPSAAHLGLLLTLPLLLWQGWRRGVQVVGFLAIVLGGLMGVQRLTAAPEAVPYRQIDMERARLFDYRQVDLVVDNPVDSLAYKTLIPYHGINDTVLLNKAFFQRVSRPVKQHLDVTSYRNAFVTAVGSTVLRLNVLLLVVGISIAVVIAAVRHRRLPRYSWRMAAFWGYQLAFWAIFLVLVPHLPLRVLQPIMNVYALTNVLMVFGLLIPQRSWPRWPLHPRWLVGVAAALALIWLVVNGRLLQQLRHDDQVATAYLRQVRAEAAQGVLVEQGLYAAYVHLNPFADSHLYDFYKVLSLTGWNAFDPSQLRLRQALTGSRDLPTALGRLGQRPTTTWLLEPGFATFLAEYLNARLNLPPGQRVYLEPAADSQLPPVPAGWPRRYYFRLR